MRESDAGSAPISAGSAASTATRATTSDQRRPAPYRSRATAPTVRRRERPRGVDPRRRGQENGMAPISDAVVVDVLRRIDRLAGPGVRRLGRPPSRPQDRRGAWWAGRVSLVAAGVAAAPRFLGRMADLLPLQNTVGTAVQSLIVLGVAGEHGV